MGLDVERTRCVWEDWLPLYHSCSISIQVSGETAAAIHYYSPVILHQPSRITQRSPRVSIHVSAVSLHLQLEGVWQRAADPSRLMRGEIAAGLLGSSTHTHTHTTPPPTTCRMEAISKHLQDHKRCTAGVDMSSQSKLPGAGMQSGQFSSWVIWREFTLKNKSSRGSSELTDHGEENHCTTLICCFVWSSQRARRPSRHQEEAHLQQSNRLLHFILLRSYRIFCGFAFKQDLLPFSWQTLKTCHKKKVLFLKHNSRFIVICQPEEISVTGTY